MKKLKNNLIISLKRCLKRKDVPLKDIETNSNNKMLYLSPERETRFNLLK